MVYCNRKILKFESLNGVKLRWLEGREEGRDSKKDDGGRGKLEPWQRLG